MARTRRAQQQQSQVHHYWTVQEVEAAALKARNEYDIYSERNKDACEAYKREKIFADREPNPYIKAQKLEFLARSKYRRHFDEMTRLLNDWQYYENWLKANGRTQGQIELVQPDNVAYWFKVLSEEFPENPAHEPLKGNLFSIAGTKPHTAAQGRRRSSVIKGGY